jgi:hypothetical protein
VLHVLHLSLCVRALLLPASSKVKACRLFNSGQVVLESEAGEFASLLLLSACSSSSSWALLVHQGCRPRP